ncbi:MAG: aminoglycoside phosphotransferase family protein [Verrucomicrobia bacterium]|nr:aminoglycoside phosphotransferase family protein [Verrucomicrobiota bacterium]
MTPLDPIIISNLKTYYGIEVASLTLLSLGADIYASVYKVLAVDKKAYFIKLKKGHRPDLSVEVVELLQSAGIRQIIPPVKTPDERSTQRIDGFTLIVYPFVDGQDGFHRHLTDDQWTTLGKAMRQVHGLDVPISLQNHIRKETYSDKWRQMVRSMYETQPIADELALRFHKFLQKNIAIVRRLVDRAQELGDRLRNHSPEFVLCHSDIHAGNVLINENHFYIVDWDEPIMAPKERDLMFIGGGVGNVWNKANEEKLFYQGYGKTEIDPIALAYYRHERIVEDIAIYSQELLLSAEGKDRPQMFRHFIDQFAPQGVVEIAFKTDLA